MMKDKEAQQLAETMQAVMLGAMRSRAELRTEYAKALLQTPVGSDAVAVLAQADALAGEDLRLRELERDPSLNQFLAQLKVAPPLPESGE